MKAFGVGILALVLVLLSAETRAEDIPFPDISRVTAKAVKSMLGDKDIVILDVRPEEQWAVAEAKIARSAHEDPKKVKTWLKNYTPDQTLILYCA